jgi:hypothetical protein
MIAAIAACNPQQFHFSQPLVECPHNWGTYVDSTIDSGQLVLPGRITNIPEFHDCQRFIATTGNGLTYMPIFAVFGAWDLSARWDSVLAHPALALVTPLRPVALDSVSGALTVTATLQQVQSPPSHAPTGRPSATARSGWAFVEILSEGSYAPLGIGPGFNCAFVYVVADTPQARMVHFEGAKEPDCRQPVDPDTLGGTILNVHRTIHPSHPDTLDYPAAARWDWDPQHQIQYFGVKCGAAWCEVGLPGFVASPLPSLAAAALENGQRVRHIKGWFDQQRLAPALVANPDAPSPGWGTIFADLNLVDRKVSDFSGNWLLVARATVDTSLAAYESKWNLAPAAPDQSENLVYLCKGEWETCRVVAQSVPDLAPGPIPDVAPTCPNAGDVTPADSGVWWTGIVSTKASVKFACVIRRDHSKALADLGLKPTGTVRWRWRDQDETIWISCDAGCCEVQQIK